MSDMNALTIILLAEASIVLLIVLIVVLWRQLRSSRDQRKAVEQLVSQIKTQSKTRTEQTGSFLEEVYDLSDTELKTAVQSIDKQERIFFQKLVDVLGRSDTSQITSLDASVAELVDTYKSLKPKPVELAGKAADGENNEDEIEALKAENANLTEELKITRDTMSGMIAEFGNMFGGGQDHDLDSSEVTEKVVASDKSDASEDVTSPSSDAGDSDGSNKVDLP